jgi:hypothetical protein
MAREMGRLAEAVRQQVACEAAVLLNQAEEDLQGPSDIVTLYVNLKRTGQVSQLDMGMAVRMAMRSLVISLCRLKEIRDHFLEGWLLSDADLQQLGLPRIEEFLGDWRSLVTIEGQYTGHALRGTPTSPGRLIPAPALGEAARKAGLWDADKLFRRIRTELLPGVSAVKRQLTEQYPKAKTSFRQYLDELRATAEGHKETSP